MRAIVHCALAMAAMTVAAGTSDVTPTAAHLPLGPDVESISPAQGAVVGVGHAVVVTFGRPVADRTATERAIRIGSAPAMTGNFEWLESNVVQWVPDRFWPAHSTVKLSVGGIPTVFQTGPAVVGVADISEHTFTVTIDGVGTDSPIRLPAPHHLPHVGEEGVLLATMGRPEYPTPVGTYTVLAKDRDVIMDSSSVGIPITDPDGYRLVVDYAVRITRRGLYVHSAPWAIPSMGFENVSHGCIGLIPAAAEWYFDNVNIGDPVIVQE